MIKVVDASTAIKWFVPETNDAEAKLLLDANKYELHAPELLTVEFGSIVWKKFRRGQLTETEAKQITNDFLRFRIQTHSHNLLLAALNGALQTGLTVYDWSYLALAVSLDCEMVTADEKFYRALETTNLKRHLLFIADVI